MKKLLALVLALAMTLSVGFTAAAEPIDSTDAMTMLNVCLASEPDTLDPALNSAVDGATMVSHLFSGLSTWKKNDEGVLVIVPECAVDLP